MRHQTIVALLALGLAATFGLPQNMQEVVAAEEGAVEVARGKGDTRLLETMSDGAYVRTCYKGECKMMTAGNARSIAPEDILSISAPKGDMDMQNALQPTFATMANSMKGLNAQKALLENLQREMASMSMAFNKGAQLAEDTKGQFAATMTKGITFSAPPSKGGSAAASMQLEAAMCPMTMYELGKCQKVYGETRQQLDSAHRALAIKSSQKIQLENALAASETLKKKAQEQAAFNAKYAAEQKNQAEMLAMALAQANAAKAALEQAKAELENVLGATQNALSQEKIKNMVLTSNLQDCNSAKDQLEGEKAVLIQELNREQAKRQECEEVLGFTSQKLAQTEIDLAEETAKREQTEVELGEARAEIASCKDELATTTQALDDTKKELTQTQDSLARETTAREAAETKLADTQEQLLATQETLRQTESALENEQNAHGRTQRELAATKLELAATEQARRRLEEAKQQLEDELAETKHQLDSMTDERDQLQVTLDATAAALGQCNQQNQQCQAALLQEKAITNHLNSQLQDAMTMLAAEKKAREELTATIFMVKAASEKIQEEVRRLQIENVQLQQQVMKLRSEQETAMALASGCPPTYEKFGLSCYKYVREKTQWKMAQEQCMKDSGNLVSVESRQEQAFLVDYLKRHEARFDDKYLHLGGFDYHADGVFKWMSTKNPVDFGDTYWMQNNPRGKGRRCLAFQTWDMDHFGQWADEYCWVPLPFMCEVETAPFMAK